LLITRRWNAQQDGVYVPLSDEVQPNPYLKDPQRDVVTTTGVRFTKVNIIYRNYFRDNYTR
jgi:two-component system NtrC family sensor kinase